MLALVKSKKVEEGVLPTHHLLVFTGAWQAHVRNGVEVPNFFDHLKRGPLVRLELPFPSWLSVK